MENSPDSQIKFGELQGQGGSINTMAEDQHEHEERLEEMQAQLQTTRDQVRLQGQTINAFHSLQNEFATFNDLFMKLQANPSIEALHNQVNNLLQDLRQERQYSRSLHANYDSVQESNQKFHQTNLSQSQQIHQLEQQLKAIREETEQTHLSQAQNPSCNSYFRPNERRHTPP